MGALVTLAGFGDLKASVAIVIPVAIQAFGETM
jgi:hypothetical protein